MMLTEWQPEAHVPAAGGRRRTMHGVEVRACGMSATLDQYDPLANHGPHLHSDGAAWCPGYSTSKWVCPTAPESRDAGRDHTHGAHAWQMVERGTWLWCPGYRGVYSPLPPSDRPTWSRWDEADREAGWLEPRDGRVATYDTHMLGG